MAMVPDCPQFYVMMWTQLAVHGLALFLEIRMQFSNLPTPEGKNTRQFEEFW